MQTGSAQLHSESFELMGQVCRSFNDSAADVEVHSNKMIVSKLLSRAREYTFVVLIGIGNNKRQLPLLQRKHKTRELDVARLSGEKDNEERTALLVGRSNCAAQQLRIANEIRIRHAPELVGRPRRRTLPVTHPEA